SFSNAGTIIVGSGSTFTVGGTGAYSQTGGASRFQGGTLIASGALSLTGGTLTGTGTISGNVVNSSQMTPGSAPGILNITGDYTQTNAGALNIEIGGLTPGTQFDQLKISGAATLNGTLNLSLLNAFAPQNGNTFQVLTFASHSGQFAIINGATLGNGAFFQTLVDPRDVTLLVAAAKIEVNPTSGLITTEAGGSATFTMVLDSQPTANVSVALSSSNPAEGTVSPASVTFTPGNWNVPQTATVTGTG